MERKNFAQVLKDAKIDENKKAGELSNEELGLIRDQIEKYPIEGDIRNQHPHGMSSRPGNKTVHQYRFLPQNVLKELSMLLRFFLIYGMFYAFVNVNFIVGSILRICFLSFLALHLP